MPKSKPVGECSWDWQQQEAMIRILDPKHNKSAWPSDKNVELTIVHELTHCIVSPILKRPSLHEQAVEKLARSFYASN